MGKLTGIYISIYISTYLSVSIRGVCPPVPSVRGTCVDWGGTSSRLECCSECTGMPAGCWPWQTPTPSTGPSA